jgi:hypothetical protein
MEVTLGLGLRRPLMTYNCLSVGASELPSEKDRTLPGADVEKVPWYSQLYHLLLSGKFNGLLWVA